jgi:subtilisin family serine protease
MAFWLTGFPGDASAAGKHSAGVQRLIERADREPALAEEPVTVIIEDGLGSDIKTHVSAAEGKIRYSVGRRHEVTIRRNRLSRLISLLPATSMVRLSYPHQPLAVTSQGVALTGGVDMHAVGNNGAGIKAGVIDIGFASLASAQASGDLPTNLNIVDYTGTGMGGDTHGTNVAQIVYDMAPGSQIYLAKVDTDVQLQQAIIDMVTAGVRVINHSVGWYGAAFYDGTGDICDAVNQAVASNVVWVNAMGNDRFRHYMAVLTDSNNDRRHEFAAGQNYNTVTLTAGVTYDFVLNWDAYPTTNIDYNLYLYNGNPDAGGVEVANSDSRQIGSIPYERITYTPSVNGTYYLTVQKYRTNTANVRFALFVFGADLGVFTSASSITQPADCTGAIGVAATYPNNDVPEYFSSEGPTTDGRDKPEVAAPDRVQTSLTSSFAGTSAASPHVAGGAALLRAQNPTLTPDQIRWLLTSTAKDVYTVGFDYRTGNGRMSLDADGDGYNHDADNCPLTSNPGQTDADGDDQGDACDADDDNDGLSDAFELSIGTDPLRVDTDGDGLTDYAEVSYDGNPAMYTPGSDLDPLSRDTDGDGTPDGSDTDPLVSSQTGDIAPLGGPDGVIDVADYMLAQQIVLGKVQATVQELARADLYPPGAPDGIIDVSDLMVLLSRVR